MPVAEQSADDIANDVSEDDLFGDVSEVGALDDDSGRSEAARNAIEWVVILVSAVVLALVFRAFLFQAFSIPSGSMEQTLQIDDRVMVNRLSYRLHDVNRGDVVVFHKPEGLQSEHDELIKRVVAIAGESIEGKDNAVYIDGNRVAEPYLDPSDTIFDFGPVVIPDGHVFVMGDNRDNSSDSRVFGPIPTDTIVGRAFFIYWPLGRVQSL